MREAFAHAGQQRIGAVAGHIASKVHSPLFSLPYPNLTTSFFANPIPTILLPYPAFIVPDPTPTFFLFASQGHECKHRMYEYGNQAARCQLLRLNPDALIVVNGQGGLEYRGFVMGKSGGGATNLQVVVRSLSWQTPPFYFPYLHPQFKTNILI